jgi:hypothetical protein
MAKTAEDEHHPETQPLAAIIASRYPKACGCLAAVAGGIGRTLEYR